MAEVRRRGYALVATDGASKGGCWEERIASFGIAVGKFRFRGELGGMDHTAYKAEVWALYRLLQSIQGVQQDIRLMIDNLAVVQEANLRKAGRATLRCNTAGLWLRIGDILDTCPGLSIAWVPSHGKKRGEWTPPTGQSEQEWRDLNQAADDEASAARDAKWEGESRLREHWARAAARACPASRNAHTAKRSRRRMR